MTSSLDEIENVVQNTLYAKLHTLQVVEKVAVQASRTRWAGVSQQLRSTDKRLAEIKAEKIHQYEACAEGNIPCELYREKRIALQREEDELTERRESLSAQILSGEEARKEMKQCVEDGETFLTKRKLTKEDVEAFIEAVYIYDGTRVEIKFKFEDVLIRALEDGKSLSDDCRQEESVSRVC